MNYTTCFHILNLIESVNFSDGSNTILSNIDRTRTCPFVDDRTRTPYFWLRTIEPNTVFTTFTKLLIELTRTSFFRTSNELERVHLMVIDLDHPIFGFERSNIELRTLFDPSLVNLQD